MNVGKTQAQKALALADEMEVPLSRAVMATPTGNARNNLCDAQIFLTSAIERVKAALVAMNNEGNQNEPN